MKSCIDCKFYNICLMSGFESCEKGNDLPNSKRVCKDYEESN